MEIRTTIFKTQSWMKAEIERTNLQYTNLRKQDSLGIPILLKTTKESI